MSKQATSLTDDDLDRVAAALGSFGEKKDPLGPKRLQAQPETGGENSFFRPNPDGEGTIEHF